MPQRVIHLHPAAPPKPPTGQACNGCGACCAAEPCPLGILASRRRLGPCAALRWNEPQRPHACGLLTAGAGGPLAGLFRRAVRRSIAAGAGCDADLELSG